MNFLRTSFLLIALLAPVTDALAWGGYGGWHGGGGYYGGGGRGWYGGGGGYYGGGRGWYGGGYGRYGGWGGSGFYGGVVVGPSFGYGYGMGWPYYAPYYNYPPAVVTVPVPTSPPVYIEQSVPQQSIPQDPANYWHYCADPPGYYPTVKECPGGWQLVPPQPPSPQ